MHASNLHALTAQHDEQRKVFRAPEADDDWKPAQCRFLSLHLFLARTLTLTIQTYGC